MTRPHETFHRWRPSPPPIASSSASSSSSSSSLRREAGESRRSSIDSESAPPAPVPLEGPPLPVAAVPAAVAADEAEGTAASSAGSMVDGHETDGGKCEVECWKASACGSFAGLSAGQVPEQQQSVSAHTKRGTVSRGDVQGAHFFASRVW
jgi:hypothetical protein